MKTLTKALILIAFMPIGELMAQDTISIYDMSLEQLMALQVTSVSKKAEKIKEVPAAIYVITERDIKHSGVTTLAALLQSKVPGYWAVSHEYDNSATYIRNALGGSVLVLLDGVPMQDLVQSEFKYGNFDIPLNQIERIEIIRGSGGTVYGANSATGVISIVSKKSGRVSYFEANTGMPAYGSLNGGVGTHVTDNLSLSVYGRTRYFSGFKQMSETDGTTHSVPSSYATGNTTITNRFTADDNTKIMNSAGFNFNYDALEKLTVSGSLHYNGSKAKKYVTTYPDQYNILAPTPGNPTVPRPLQTGDTLFLLNDNPFRVLGQLIGEYVFTEKHNAFVKFSTNAERYRYALGGSVESDNKIYDIEIQDNLTLGFNQISLGANHRILKYNMTNVKVPDILSFINPKNTESLTGAFIQDKLSLIDDKLEFFGGLKAENFSLIDSKYYFSPMLKVVVKPIENTMVWAGYTKSYTTPGYIQTNVEFRLFRAKSPDVFYNYAKPMVQYGVLEQTKAELMQKGQDETTASAMAQGFVGSPAGMYLVDSLTKQNIATNAVAFPGHFNVSAVNGKNIVPTAISTFEIGFRTQPFSKLTWEGNLYYSNVDGGVINTPKDVAYTASKTIPGEFQNVYYYGNYLKGTIKGIENVVKINPVKALFIELSHTWMQYSFEYAKNNDFDVNQLSSDQRTLKRDYPTVPQHVFRCNAGLELPANWFVSGTLVYTGKFRNSFGTVDDFYQYDNQRLEPLVGDIAVNKFRVGEVVSRSMVNLKVEKELLYNKLNLYVYGNDILTSTIIESVSILYTAYPRQIGRTFGAGVRYTF